MLGVALAAGGAAAYLASGSKPAPGSAGRAGACVDADRRGARRGKRAQFRSGGRRRRHLLAGLGPTPARGRKSENPNALADVKGSLAPARHFLGGRTVPPRPSRQGTDGGADVYHAVNRHESGRDRHRFPGRHQAVVSSCRTITSTSCALIATTKPPRRPAAMS
jgi:hypothetical protein